MVIENYFVKVDLTTIKKYGLTFNEYHLLDMVNALHFYGKANGRLGCYASIEYFTKTMRCNSRTVERIISKMKDKNILLRNADGCLELLIEWPRHDAGSAPDATPVKDSGTVPVEASGATPDKHNTNKHNIKKHTKKKLVKTSSQKTRPSKSNAISKESLKEIQSIYNEITVDKLPKAIGSSLSRQIAVGSRIASFGRENVLEVIKTASTSQFLTGNNPRNWNANFDWIFKEANFIKILEGNYSNKKNEEKEINGIPARHFRSANIFK